MCRDGLEGRFSFFYFFLIFWIWNNGVPAAKLKPQLQPLDERKPAAYGDVKVLYGKPCNARAKIDELLNSFGVDVSMEHDVFDMRALCILWKNDMQAGRCGAATPDSLDCRGSVRIASGYGQLSLF